MPGFYISNFDYDVELINVEEKLCRKDTFSEEDFVIKRNITDKFIDDKLFYRDQEVIILTDGVTLNKKDLEKRCSVGNLSDLIINLEKNDNVFFSKFRGSFTGAFYTRHRHHWTFWTEQMGFNALFYYWDGYHFIVASQVNYIIDTLRYYQIPITIDEQGVYSILTYGFMYDSRTYASQIKRLLPGHYISLDLELKEFIVSTYFALEENKIELPQTDDDFLIEEIDRLISNSITMSFEKDEEYGYKHLADMSGGLDCRMVSWVAHDLGFKNTINIHYSATESYELKYSQKIVKLLSNELIYKALDDCAFLYDIDRITAMNYGLSVYCGITGGERLLRSLNLEEIGIEHMGLNGDNILAGPSKKDMFPFMNDQLQKPYSNKLQDRIDKTHLGKYRHSYICLNDIRGRLGSSCPSLIRRNYLEPIDPFADPDFIDFMFSIPIEKRYGYRLYYLWILKKHPDAVKVKREGYCLKIGSPETFELLCKILRKGPRYILRKIGIELFSRKEMHPFEYWYKKKPDIKEFFDSYFNAHIKIMKLTGASSALVEDIERLFTEGSFFEKAQVLTVLSACRLYFFDNGE